MASCILKQRAVKINANGGGACGRYLKEQPLCAIRAKAFMNSRLIPRIANGLCLIRPFHERHSIEAEYSICTGEQME